MEIETIRWGDRPFTSLATEDHPTYLIQPLANRRDPRIPVLLGQHLQTYSLAVGKVVAEKYSAHSLQCKTDSRDGVTFLGINYPLNIYDVAGIVGGESDVEELVCAGNGRLYCRVRQKFEKTNGIINEKMPEVVLSDIIAGDPTLIISRRDLRKLIPDLGSDNANPFRGEVKLISHTFDQIVDIVRRKITAGRYILLD